MKHGVPIPTNRRADEEARLAYALIVGLSFDDGLAMIQGMFKTDEMGACDLIVRGKRLADSVEKRGAA
jgi:hypothetical protein